MLRRYKNYATLALNCMLKNLKEIISVLETKIRDKNNVIKEEINI